MPLLRHLTALTLTASLLVACGEPSGSIGDGPHPLPGTSSGKDDNYISTLAQEFILSGQAHAKLPDGFAQLPSEEEKQAAIDKAIDSRISTLGYAVRSHVNEVIRESNKELDEEATKYFTYFKSNATKPGEAEVLDDGQVRFDFAIEFVGSLDLIGHIAPEADEKQERSFVVHVEESFGGHAAESVTVHIAPSPSRDAFPKYDELFADGVFDIAIHFGGDYNAERYDIETAKWTVEYLLEEGFANPEVKDFASLTIDSPPFTRTLKVEGRDVEVQVKVVHADMADVSTGGPLDVSIRESLKTADVVMYSGHAGPNSGFVLDYHPNNELDEDEFETLELPEKYQIYVFDGCQTYRTYVDDMMKNPAKTFDNLDIVTAVNTTPFSLGYQVIHEFLFWFTIATDAGTHYPLSWQTILEGLNTEDYDDVHYGVHGIDNDPKLNPNGADAMCKPCQRDADCGGGGNFCLDYPGGSACGVACTTAEACGAGFECKRLDDDPELFYMPKQCIATGDACVHHP